MCYFIRSVKYFVALCVLCVILMALMLVTGTSALSLHDTIFVMFHTTRYALLLCAIVVLSALYPWFGFVERRLRGDVVRHRAQIINAFHTAGFELHHEADGVLYFRAGNFVKKLMLLFEDEIKVSQEGESIVVDGIRRGVARVVYRLDSYIEMFGDE